MPELRKDPITGRWVIIATGRVKRPLDFIRKPVPVPRPGTVCPFCPGNENKTTPEILAFRPSGPANGPGWTLRVIPNKFPALQIEGEAGAHGDGMFDRMNGIGAHEVIIETPEHHRSLADLPENRIKDLLWSFRCRVLDLRQDKRFKYVVLFKNHGEAAGASLEHTHSQLIALPVVPQRVQEELAGAESHYKLKERCIFCDIVRHEIKNPARLVLKNDDYLAVEPYAPRFPFETWILPQRHASHFEEAGAESLDSLAWALKTVLRKLDQTLERPAYNLAIHTAPMQEASIVHFHWHIEIMPKLTPVAGFEWATGFHINPTPPEESARFLREVELVS